MKVLKFVLVFFLFLIIGLALTLSIYYVFIPKIETSVSILVLGRGGEGHIAPDLTDTIMFVNFNSSSDKISVLSLPRDIWIPETRAKLNSSYYWGKQKSGNGFDLAAVSVAGITGITPAYFVVVDFSLFKDFIDALDGVKVNVINSFVDDNYPIEGKENDMCNGDKLYRCRYETVQFVQGIQYMDGKTALKFVRSRNAKGEEGTDFAREARQQVLISAVKEKVLSGDVLLNPTVIRNLIKVVSSHVETNIKYSDLKILTKFLLKSATNISFIKFPQELSEVSTNNPRYDRQYVLVPKNGSWEDFKIWLGNHI